MSAYHTFTSTRTTEPDIASLQALLRAADATVGVQRNVGSPTVTLKKATDWSPGDIAFAQNVIDTAPAASASLTAQANIAVWPIEMRAFVYALLDQINVLRAGLPTPLAPITPAQVLAGIVAKAKTLSS